ncbi:MAG: DEAD/DEAH box helicase [Kiritimatiellia bacterium]
MLIDWAGTRVFREGKTLCETGRVEHVSYEHPFVRGTLIYGNRNMTCQFEILKDGSVASQCPCRDNTERGIICAHVIAMALIMIKRQTDPERERKYEEERRRAERLSSMDESRYLKRVPAGTPGALPCKPVLVLGAGWRTGGAEGYPLSIFYKTASAVIPADQMDMGTPIAVGKQDDNLLFVLEDIAGGPVPGRMNVQAPDFINLLKLLPGKPFFEGSTDNPLTVNSVKMNSVIRMHLDPANGELVLMIHTELPFMDPAGLATYIVHGKEGWVFDAGQFWPLSNALPGPLQNIYRAPVCIARPSVPRFMQTELPLIEAHIRVDTDVSFDLFTIEPAEPRFVLNVRGSPASLSAQLLAVYGEHSLAAGKADAAGQFALPDPEDLMRYTVRNPSREAQALEVLRDTGFAGEHGDALAPVVGCREVLNFLGSGLPKLRRLGWTVALAGRIEPFMDELDFTTPVIHVENGEGGNWFEVGFMFEDTRGQSLSEAEIQRALMKGDSYVEKNGRTILLDADAIQTARNVFMDCATGEGSRPGRFRLEGLYSAYIQSSLDALDGVDVEAAPAWLEKAREQNRGVSMRPVPLPGNLESVLRHYQKDGVNWLRFLEGNHLCGILADEMGLGKTLQTLAWLRLQRMHEEAAGKPALIVCPTSLVENWAEEVERFVPDMKVLTISGADRHEKWDDIEHADIVITSYALLRRDIDQYLAHTFSCAILDEAQHIKNRSTQNSLAAKKINAVHRLVLTGTPIENSVADLWSIMDFLMPGYLGRPQVFREHYELPIAGGGPEADMAQVSLRRKLQPFLLRRLKKDVAKELPPKIERIAPCTLTADQQLVYKKILEQSRQKISGMVSAQGFNRSRMEIFKTLLRLRQICCHLELLKLKDLESQYPSAKLDLFFELLDEALDAKHRVLVFSQFTSMLAILKRELTARDRAYCYLDGATKERMKVVREFNTNRDIPVFLISLKAGGTGLNLTGADMVIHYDPWWNPAVEDQATDRAYRIGQKKTVYSVKLITHGTVEEKVLEMQKRKKAVINATLAPAQQMMESLTWEDVRELLDI